MRVGGGVEMAVVIAGLSPDAALMCYCFSYDESS